MVKGSLLYTELASWRTTFCHLSVSAYSVHSQLLAYLEAIFFDSPRTNMLLLKGTHSL